ncbi:dipeptide transport system permease protein DppC [Flavobacteriaceae bacterium UJ101]|nr:dipeptide transport system permease protein DppC [Flavobacteriaceae bacterium UJ101]
MIFKKNIIGSFSILIILISGFIAVFGYAIAPDSTENANQMHITLANKPIGFTTQILQIPIQGVTQKNILEQLFLGKKVHFEEVPVLNTEIKDNKIIRYTTASGEKKNLTSPLDKTFLKTKTFYLGTDKYGRDFLSRLLIGTRISFFVGFIAVLISLIVGVTLGALAGYFGGKIDAFIMWIINIIWSIPTLLLVIAITLALGKGFFQVFIAVGLTMWVEVARITRGQFISIKEKEFVEAGRALGFSDLRLIFHHILPNAWGPIIVISAANFAAAILIESGLSFLGIGAQPPVPSWGSIIKEHYSQIILGNAHLAIAPGLCIMLLVLSFMLLGNILRDELDTKES